MQSLSSALPLASILLLAGTAAGQTVTFSGGVLTINTSAVGGDRQIQVDVGPSPGFVQLSGVPGASQTSFVGVNAINLTTGAGQDFVEFRLDGTVIPPLAINTGAGNSDVKILYAIPSTPDAVTSEVSVVGAGGEDKVFFLVESQADSFIGSWRVNQSNGKNEATAEVISPDPTTLLAIAFDVSGGNSDDKAELKVTSDAAAVDVSASARLGGANDSAIVLLDNLGTGDANLQFFAGMGGGNDVVEIGNVSRGGVANFTGFVDGGANNDTLKFFSEAPGAMNLTLSGGLGADSIDWFAKGLVTGTPKLLGGSGNDVLKLIVDGPQVATPFIDGGPGFDIAIGFGTIVNCEQVN